MDSRRIETLLEKYWSGETTLQEEYEVKAYLKEYGLPTGTDEESSYFQLLSAYEQRELSSDFDAQVLTKIGHAKGRYRLPSALKAAAGAAILIAACFFIYRYDTSRQLRLAELREAREAFELTKKALFLVSSELNRGANFTKELEEFDLTVEKIKNREASIELHN